MEVSRCCVVWDGMWLLECEFRWGKREEGGGDVLGFFGGGMEEGRISGE